MYTGPGGDAGCTGAPANTGCTKLTGTGTACTPEVLDQTVGADAMGADAMGADGVGADGVVAGPADGDQMDWGGPP
ncbi:MAG: hypothetical protein ACSLE6_01415 [Mycobacterium sp.]